MPMDERGIAVPSWVRDLVRDAPASIGVPRGTPPSQRDRAQERAARELRRIIYTAIRRFADSLTWELRVPGRYRGGASYEDVLGYLADKGKDFAADSATLHRRVRDALMAEYEDADAIPLALEFRETASNAIIETIVARFENRLRDVGISANSYAYSKAKIAKGYDSRVGIRTGALLAAIKERGSVRVRASTR